ncbi:MAG TPA: hypothetical protein VGN18_12720 [Jatrophihabitans sp.]|jgi:hypothetical protein|uniref:hypothetical protein n=1 Tax=Jatrophihabitans sp. TaxID=1932789 RepID=UPI002DFF772E|nr:hypothetical protein [Jatrophihabitans sp.]
MTEALARRRPRFIFLSNGVSEDERFGWRLVAANNRPMGRGIHAHDSLAACRAAATAIHRHRAGAATATAVDVARGHWTWRIGVDSTPSAVSVHRYLRRVECLRALAQFLAALELADPAAGVVRCFGPNSLRAYESTAATVQS